jgi:hypothetical protein
MATRVYNHLVKEGPKTTAQIKDWLNNDFRPKSEGNASNKFKFTVTSEQISGLMRTSPLFVCIGDDRLLGENGKHYIAKVYHIVPVATVVNKMLDSDGQLKKHRLRKRLPSVIREEIKSRGLKI